MVDIDPIMRMTIFVDDRVGISRCIVLDDLAPADTERTRTPDVRADGQGGGASRPVNDVVSLIQPISPTRVA